MIFSLLFSNLLIPAEAWPWLSKKEPTATEKLQQSMRDGGQAITQAAQAGTQMMQEMANQGYQFVQQGLQIPANQIQGISKGIIAKYSNKFGMRDTLEYLGLAERAPASLSQRIAQRIGFTKEATTIFQDFLVLSGIKKQQPTLLEQFGLQDEYDNIVSFISNTVDYIQDTASDAVDYARNTLSGLYNRVSGNNSSISTRDSEGFRFTNNR